MKNNFLYWWKLDYYTMAQFRMVTRQNATSKKFSFEEFEANTGVSVATYDANVDQYKDMVYSDLVEAGYITQA